MANFVRLSNGDFNLILNGKPYFIMRSHPAYDKVVGLLKQGNVCDDELEKLVDIATNITNKCGDKVSIIGEKVFYQGTEIHGTIIDRLLALLDDGFDVEPWVKFIENLMQNPSARSVNELYGFLEHRGMVITEDGCFLAYKGVSDDLMDLHSGNFDNSPGNKHSVPRNNVDDNCNNTCSFGFHVGSLDYARSWGPRVVIVKVNPKDAVSVPVDHNAQKLRVCAYEVLFELENKDYLCGSLYSTSGERKTPTEVVDEAVRGLFDNDGEWNEDDDYDDDDYDGEYEDDDDF